MSAGTVVIVATVNHVDVGTSFFVLMHKYLVFLTLHWRWNRFEISTKSIISINRWNSLGSSMVRMNCGLGSEPNDQIQSWSAVFMILVPMST